MTNQMYFNTKTLEKFNFDLRGHNVKLEEDTKTTKLVCTVFLPMTKLSYYLILNDRQENILKRFSYIFRG